MIYEQWLADGVLLAEIGAALVEQPTELNVRLPRALADAAVSAWQRDDERLEDAVETKEQRTVRHRAVSLALIGEALEDSGREEGNEVIVKLDAWFIGDALRAHDDLDEDEGAQALTGPDVAVMPGDRGAEQLSHLLHFALVEIRSSVYAGDNERARKLADAFHNSPSAFRTGDFRAVTADAAARLQRHGVDLELMPLSTWDV